MKLTDRVNALKNQLTESNYELKKIESGWIQSIDSYNAVRNNLEKPTTPEGLKVIAGQYKEIMAKQIDLFRVHADIIGKISPKARNILENKINELEKNDREFQKRNFEQDITQDQINPLMKKYNTLYEEIHSSIEIFRLIIHDTIKKFED
mgnify:CR=1 FL=1